MVLDYFISNFPLLCVVIVMAILSWQNRKTRRKISSCFFTITMLTLALSFTLAGETYFKQSESTIFMATLSTFLGYVIRPLCLYFLIILAERELTRKKAWLFFIPCLVNFAFYLPSLFFFFEPFQHWCFYYVPDGLGGLSFTRGYFNYTAHIVSALYLAYLTFRSVKGLRGKHRADSYPLLICSAFIVGAVVFEMVGTAMGILNNTIAITCVFYYLFILDQANRRDALTGLFDRKTYYADLDKFGRSIRGVIELDMNGLKAINDNQGHLAGDEALAKIGRIFEDAASKKQYVYRVGGDEFTILQTGGGPKDIDDTVERIKNELAAAGLHCSIGAVFSPDTPPDDLIKWAEVIMYDDKSKFYENNPNIERRKH